MKKHLSFFAILITAALVISGCTPARDLSTDKRPAPPAEQVAQVSSVKAKPRVFVTGFEPFGGRKENGSWLAAESLKDSDLAIINALQLPVVWGAPKKYIEPLCKENPPDIIICMGEGRDGWFDIETVARNLRDEIPDNLQKMPPASNIDSSGPGSFRTEFPAKKLCDSLKAKGYNVRMSTNAGGFLCEEAFYTIEQLKTKFPAIKTVIFVHLPPLGSKVPVNGTTVTSDRTLMAAFAKELLAQVIIINEGK